MHKNWHSLAHANLVITNVLSLDNWTSLLYNCTYSWRINMDIVIDTSAIVAVIFNEPERKAIIKKTTGQSLMGPSSISWEIGNAFSAMFIQGRLTIKEVLKAFKIFEQIPLRYTSTDFSHTLRIVKQANIYAYDAYFLDCAIRYNSPILTLDKKLLDVAKTFNVTILEV